MTLIKVRYLNLQILVFKHMALNGMSPGQEREGNYKEESLSIILIKAIILFKNIKLLLESEIFDETYPPVVVISDCFVLERILNDFLEVILIAEVFAKPLVHNTVETPFGFFLSEGFSPPFLFHGTLLQFPFLLFTHFHLLNLWALLCFYSLKLDCVSFVFHLWNRKLQVQGYIKLLLDVIESQLDHHLSELCISLRIFHCVSIPNEIINLNRVSLFIVLFSHISKG